MNAYLQLYVYNYLYLYTSDILSPKYEDFINVISDPANDEYEEMSEWAGKDTGGRKFEPEYFYLSEINRKLAKIK